MYLVEVATKIDGPLVAGQHGDEFAVFQPVVQVVCFPGDRLVVTTHAVQLDLVGVLERCLDRFSAGVGEVRDIARLARHQLGQAVCESTGGFPVRTLGVYRCVRLQQFNGQLLQLGRIVAEQRRAKAADKVRDFFASRVYQRCAAGGAVRRIQTGCRKQIGQLWTAVVAVIQFGIGPKCRAGGRFMAPPSQDQCD